MEHGQRLLAAQHRLAQHYLDRLRTMQKIYSQGNESATHALTMFDRERDQVKQWQAWASTYAGQDKQATALCSAYAGDSPDTFKLRLLPQEYILWLEAALEAARRLGDQHAEVTHLLKMCTVNELINEHPHIMEYAQQALSIARQIDDRPLVAQSLNLCANATRRRGNLEEAQAYYEQSPALCRKIGNQEGLATCLSNLGFLMIRLGSYTAASDYLEQALALFQMMGDKRGLSMVLTNLGNAAAYQGEYSRARSYLEQSLATTIAAGGREREVASLYALGKVTMAQGDLLAAQGYFKQILAFSGSVEINLLLSLGLGNLAIIYLLLHQEDLAYAALYEGLETASNLSVAYAKLMLLLAAARVWILRGKPIQAARWLGMVENDPDPAIKMMDVQRDIRVARAECAAAVSSEQFAAAWEEGKTLDVDAVVGEILSELQEMMVAID